MKNLWSNSDKKVVLVPIDLPENPEGKNKSDDQDDQSEAKSGTDQELEKNPLDRRMKYSRNVSNYSWVKESQLDQCADKKYTWAAT